MRKSSILMLLAVGMLAACISGRPKSDTYTDPAGRTTVIEDDRDMCVRSCNEEYSRCMETSPAQSNYGGVHGPAGMFGASADCRKDLQNCLPTCKGR